MALKEIPSDFKNVGFRKLRKVGISPREMTIAALKVTIVVGSAGVAYAIINDGLKHPQKPPEFQLDPTAAAELAEYRAEIPVNASATANALMSNKSIVRAESGTIFEYPEYPSPTPATKFTAEHTDTSTPVPTDSPNPSATHAIDPTLEPTQNPTAVICQEPKLVDPESPFHENVILQPDTLYFLRITNLDYGSRTSSTNFLVKLRPDINTADKPIILQMEGTISKVSKAVLKNDAPCPAESILPIPGPFEYWLPKIPGQEGEDLFDYYYPLGIYDDKNRQPPIIKLQRP